LEPEVVGVLHLHHEIQIPSGQPDSAHDGVIELNVGLLEDVSDATAGAEQNQSKQTRLRTDSHGVSPTGVVMAEI
jgi:hypothetical protein